MSDPDELAELEFTTCNECGETVPYDEVNDDGICDSCVDAAAAEEEDFEDD